MRFKMRNAFLWMSLLLVGVSYANAAEPVTSGKVRVLLTYGGHGFDEKPFWALWDALPGIVYTKAEMPKAADLLKPGLEKDYDVVVLYDQWQNFTPEQETALVDLLKTGIGLVSLHHNVGSHNDWDEYRNIIGGKYLRKELQVGDKSYGPSKWRDDQDMRVTVVDRQHPITAGIDDFTICDESYRDFYTASDVKVLLTTDHPQNDPPVAWVKEYGKSRVFYLMFGHGPAAWQNPNYPRLLANGIRWAAAKADPSTKTTETKTTEIKTTEIKTTEIKTTEQPIDVLPVWSGHPVGFALLTHAPYQLVAFPRS